MKKNILIVKRNANMRRLLAAFLSEKFHVSVARSSLEAMALLKYGLLPDAIVAESRATFLNGNHLLEMLRCSGIYHDIPVIVLCEDNTSPSETEHFYNMGAAVCLSKPFNPLILQQHLLRLVPSKTSESTF